MTWTDLREALACRHLGLRNVYRSCEWPYINEYSCDCGYWFDSTMAWSKMTPEQAWCEFLIDCWIEQGTL